MPDYQTIPSTQVPTSFVERRGESRQSVAGTLWLVDHNGSTVFQCQCMEVSPSGMRLRVPLGYGVAEGQRYELRSHVPGTRPIEGFGVVGSRWATVVRTQVRLDAADDHLDVGVALDAADTTALSVSATTALV
ncbi:MAG: hypothetical protein ABIG44_08115 [Planctomycetota bacterium]